MPDDRTVFPSTLFLPPDDVTCFGRDLSRAPAVAVTLDAATPLPDKSLAVSSLVSTAALFAGPVLFAPIILGMKEFPVETNREQTWLWSVHHGGGDRDGGGSGDYMVPGSSRVMAGRQGF